MRILFCNKYNFPFSGTEMYLFELMELLRSHGHEVALFSMSEPAGQPTAYDAHFVPPHRFQVRALHGGAGPGSSPQVIYSSDARTKIREL